MPSSELFKHGRVSLCGCNIVGVIALEGGHRTAAAAAMVDAILY